jgi:hypothetical protein
MRIREVCRIIIIEILVVRFRYENIQDRFPINEYKKN